MNYFTNTLNYQNRALPVSGAPTNWLSATAKGQTITGLAGNNAIYGDGGDVLIGGSGDNTFYVNPSDTVIASSTGTNTIIVYWGSYILPANVENLVVQSPGAYADGNALDNDIVAVGAGLHTLNGGGGNNVLTGGTDENIFVHADGNNANDVITNFKPGIDEVRLDNYNLHTFAAVSADMQQVGNDVVLTLGADDSITFRNVQVSDFSAHDFMLPVDTSANLHMTFGDEFNSLNLRVGNTGIWNTSYPWAGPSGASLTGELEWYINANYAPTSAIKPWTVNNGILDLTATPTDPSIQSYVGGHPYTSGMLTTYGTFAQTYGYFEMRAELPAGQGLAPAFWLLPENKSWPPELDVMEVIGSDPTSLVTTVHSDSTGKPIATGQTTQVADTTAGFHTYAVDWEPNTITWYFDGNEVFQTATPADLHQSMFMVVNLGVGGVWPGSPNSSTAFPATMQIDYIHAFATTAAPPVIATFSPDTGIVGDGITNSNKITLSGTSEAYSTVNLFDGSVLIGTAAADGVGAWTFAAAALTDGSHAFAATDTNAAGNTSVLSNALTVTVDTHVPAAPTVGSISPYVIVNGQDVTNVNHLTLTGTAEAGSTIKIHDGSTIIGTVTGNSAGAWTFTTGLLADGTHKLSATDTDVAGTTSASSSTTTIVVDTTAPSPTITALAHNTNGSITLGGHSEAQSVVSIYDGGGSTPIGSAVTNAAGVWSFTSGALSNANHSFTVHATDIAGNSGVGSGSAVYSTAASQTISGHPGGVLAGLGAHDTFVFGPQFGKETVTGFSTSSANADVLQIDHTEFANFAAVLAHAAQVGSNLVITADPADVLTLNNVNKSALQAANVHIV
jgi:beta-glucanase (GH16 family)